MKKFLFVALLTVGIQGHASILDGQSTVAFDGESAAVQVSGMPARVIYEVMTDVESVSIEGEANTGFLKVGKNVSCTRFLEKSAWVYSCVFAISEPTIGGIVDASN